MEKGTSGATKNQAVQFLSLLNDVPELGKEGISEHQDYGYVTILYSNKSGLEAKIDESWWDIPIKQGYFIVVLGKTLESLVNDTNLIHACWHRVKEQNDRRLSFAIFSDSLSDAPVFSFNQNTKQLDKIFESSEEFHQAMGYEDEWVER